MLVERSERDSEGVLLRHPEPSHVHQSTTFRRELVRRVVQSPTFARSERLGELLTYICEMALKGREAELNEQKIGQEVFGRTQYYDSTVDGIVRTQASRLRQRLETHFNSDGANEPVRISIPRGGYVPLFEARSLPHSSSGNTSATDLRDGGDSQSPEAPPAESENSHKVSSVDTPRKEYRVWILALTLLSLLLLSVCIYQQLKLHTVAKRARSDSKLVSGFWAQLFPEGERNLIVPGDSGLVLFENLTEKQVPLNQYVSKQYAADESTDSATSLETRAKHISAKRLVSFADLTFVTELSAIPEFAASHPSVRYVRDLQLADLKGANVILIGAQEADPWLSLFQPNLSFQMSNDQRTTVFTVLNRAPQANEPASYQYDPQDSGSKAYAVISFRQNLDGRGNVLIVEGTGIAGIEAASQFILNGSRFEQVLRPISNNNKLTGHFDLLLRTDPLNGTAPRTDLVSVRYFH